MLAVLISLPSFIFFILGIYWIPVLSVLTGNLKWWSLSGPRNDIEAMCALVAAADCCACSSFCCPSVLLFGTDVNLHHMIALLHCPPVGLRC